MGGFGEVRSEDDGPAPSAPPDDSGTVSGVQDDDIDAYIFVHGATKSQINRLRLLVDNDYRSKYNLGVEGKVECPQVDKTEAAKVKAQIVAEGDAVVRSVTILAGKYDAVVAVTAAGFTALEHLVLKQIHRIISTTETTVSLYPPPRYPPPRKAQAGGAGGGGGAGGPQPPGRNVPPISGGRGGGGGYGPTWGPHAVYRAVLQIAARPDKKPQEVADGLQAAFEAAGGDLYRGASVVAGDLNILAMLGSDNFPDLKKGILETLPTVGGIARVTVSLNFQEIPQEGPT